MVVPAVPYRGIQPFRYVDHAIFLAREDETENLVDLVAIYRGALLYGASGDGKSSLINAGLLPATRPRRLSPERVRVQPRLGEEIVVERIATTEDEGGDHLPTLLAPEGDESARIVMSVQAFEDRIREVCATHKPLLIFDQFEEIVTLFEEQDAVALRRPLVEMLVRLLRDPLAVKLLFVFREDYLGKVKHLLAAVPELVDQALRLQPLSVDALPTIIRGPFEQHPGHFARELDPAFSARVCAALEQRFGSADLSLSEVETVALRLWQSDDPPTLLQTRGVQGILEDYLGEALDALSAELRAAAVALLAQMVTSAGTRNVISAEDLRQRVHNDDPEIVPALLDAALDHLERESRLVHRERRRDIYLYEITSEFLVPWISKRREEAQLARQQRRDEERRQVERARERRRRRVIGAIAGALLVVVAGVSILAVFAFAQRAAAQRSVKQARVERSVAQRRAAEAIRARAVADTQTAKATRQQDLAQRRLKDARAARTRAGREARNARAQRSEAQRQSRNARAQGTEAHLQATNATSLALAASSNEPLQTRPDVSLALAFEGYDLAPLPQARTAVVRALLAARGSHLRGVITDRTARGGAVMVAFSPDGKTLASASSGAVRLWDAATHRPLSTLAGPAGEVFAIAFSPDGKTLASAGADGTVRLWNAVTHRRVATFTGHRLGVRAVAFSANGKTLATAGGDGRVRLWDVSTHRVVATFKVAAPGGDNSTPSVLTLAFSPDGKALVVAGGDGDVRLWNPVTHRWRATLPGNAEPVSAVAFSPDGKKLASAGSDGRLRLWNPATHALLATFHAGGTPFDVDPGVAGVAFSPDGRMLASANGDRTVRLWSVATHRQIATLTGHADEVSAVAFTPDGKTLASGGYDGTVRLWDPMTTRHPARFTGSAAAFSSDGATLATATTDGRVRLWDAATHRRLKTLVAPHIGFNQPVFLAFSPAGHTLVVVDEPHVRLFDAATHVRLATRSVDGDVTAVAFSPDGKTLAIVTDKTVRLLNLAAHRRPARLRGHTGLVTAVAFSPDGKTLASASADKTVRLWDRATRKRLTTLRTGLAGAVAFSPDGTTFASSDERTVRLWDAATHRQLGTLNGHMGSVTALAFSPDGRTLASASADKTVRLWDADTQRSIATLTGHTAAVLAVAFNPKGRTLASADDHGRVRLWDEVLWRSTAELRATVCDVLLGGLTRPDWELYAAGIRYRRTCA